MSTVWACQGLEQDDPAAATMFAEAGISFSIHQVNEWLAAACQLCLGLSAPKPLTLRRHLEEREGRC